MRNLEQIERLSSTAGLGLWAEDVILALDRVARLHQRDESDTGLLEEAAAILDAALERSQEPLAATNSARALAATDTALSVAETLAEGHSPDKTQAVLRDTAASLRRAADDKLGESGPSLVESAIDFFAAVGQRQLAESNSVLAGT